MYQSGGYQNDYYNLLQFPTKILFIYDNVFS